MGCRINFIGAASAMSKAISTTHRDGGVIEMLQNERGDIYHRACAYGRCRYCEDRWQAEMYLNQILKSQNATSNS